MQYCYATGTPGQGTSNLGAADGNIVYETNPDPGEIFRVMTGYTDEVKSFGDYYPFTTTYAPSATPAYGIIPQRAVWTKDAWNEGDGTYPGLNIEAYEGRK